MYDSLFCLPCFASEMLITSLVTSYRLFNHTIYHGSISRSVKEHVVSTPSKALLPYPLFGSDDIVLEIGRPTSKSASPKHKITQLNTLTFYITLLVAYCKAATLIFISGRG